MESHLQKNNSAVFAPMLNLKSLAAAIEFCKKAFGATEHRRFSNPDGSVNVSEMFIATALFRMHEEAKPGGTTVVTRSLLGLLKPYQLIKGKWSENVVEWQLI